MKINLKTSIYIAIFLLSTQAYALFDAARDIVGGAVDVATSAVQGATNVVRDVTGTARTYPERVYTEEEVITEAPVVEKAPVVAENPAVIEPSVGAESAAVTKTNGSALSSNVIEPSVTSANISGK